MAYIGDRTVDEMSTLAFTITASDVDDPASALTFSLAPGAPQGASIDPATGFFTWTPAEFQGPGVYTITVRVSDDGTPPLQDFQTFYVTVNEANLAPDLAPIGDQFVDEGTALRFTALATDSDIPTNTLAFSLDIGAPQGAGIDPVTGEFTWTPGEIHGPAIYTVTVRVTDDGAPPRDDFETIQVVVGEVNTAPTLDAIGDQAIGEQTTLSFTVGFTDTDLPANTPTFWLGAGAPQGASIDAVTGGFTWTPVESQGPGVYEITVHVADNGVPVLNDSETFQITVNEVNTAPLLEPIGDHTVNEQSTLTFTANASDLDDPPDTLIFSLAPGSPQGASIQANTGLFTWMPDETQAPGVYTITVRVSDNGAPALEDFDTFRVMVNAVPLANAGLDQTAEEGQEVHFSASFIDPGRRLAVGASAISWDFGDGATASDTLTPTHRYIDDGAYTVTLMITDALGAAGRDTLLITVDNISPLLAALGDQEVQAGEIITFSAVFSDPGLLDTHSAVIDWGDGNQETGMINDLDRTVSGTHIYQAPRIYNVTITFTDDDGGTSVQTFKVTVIRSNYLLSLPVIFH